MQMKCGKRWQKGSGRYTKKTLGESRGFGLKGKESWWWDTNVQDKVKVKSECFVVVW